MGIPKSSSDTQDGWDEETGLQRHRASLPGPETWTIGRKWEEARVPSEATAVDPQRCQGKACQEWARGFKISGALVMGAQSNMSPQFLVSVASSCELGALFTVWKQG